MKIFFRKKIIPFLCIISLLCPLLLASCGNKQVSTDYEKLIAHFLLECAKQDKTGSGQQNGKRLDVRKEFYVNQLNSLTNISSETKERYKENLEQNIQNLKNVFMGIANDPSELDMSIFKNLIWALSPNTIMELYNNACSLSMFIDYYIDRTTSKPKRSIIAKPKFSYTDKSGIIWADKLNLEGYPFNNYIYSADSATYKSNLESFISKIEKVINEFKPEIILDNEKQTLQLIQKLKYDETDYLRLPTLTDQNIGSIDNFVKEYEGASFNKLTGVFTWHETKNSADYESESEALTEARKEFDNDPNFSDKNIQGRINELHNIFVSMGRNSYVHAYEDYIIRTNTKKVDGSDTKVFNASVTRTIVGRISSSLKYNDAGVNNGIQEKFNHQYYSGQDVDAHVNYLVEFCPLYPNNVQIQAQARDNTVFGYPTVNAALTDTGTANTDINIGSYEFYYGNGDLDLDTLKGEMEDYENVKINNKNNKTALGKIGYKVLVESGFFKKSDEVLETGGLTTPTNAKNHLDSLNYETIFDSLLKGETNDKNNQGDDFIIYFCNIPIAALRLNELKKDAEDILQETKEEKSTEGYKEMYITTKDNNTYITMVKEFANIDIIDHISGEGFTVKKTNMLYDIFNGIIKKVNENDIDNINAHAIDGLGDNLSSTRKNATNNAYNLTDSFWKAPPGEILLIKYYPLYEDTYTNSGHKIPLGRPLYINTDNLSYQAAEQWYKWRDNGKPAFYLADPVSGTKPSKDSKYGLTLGAICDESGNSINGYDITNIQYTSTADPDLQLDNPSVLNNAVILN